MCDISPVWVNRSTLTLRLRGNPMPQSCMRCEIYLKNPDIAIVQFEDVLLRICSPQPCSRALQCFANATLRRIDHNLMKNGGLRSSGAPRYRRGSNFCGGTRDMQRLARWTRTPQPRGPLPLFYAQLAQPHRFLTGYGKSFMCVCITFAPCAKAGRASFHR